MKTKLTTVGRNVLNPDAQDRGARPGLFFEKLWTVTDLALHLSVSEKTIYGWVHERVIPYQKVGRLLRFRPSKIERWLSNKGESHVN